MKATFTRFLVFAALCGLLLPTAQALTPAQRLLLFSGDPLNRGLTFYAPLASSLTPQKGVGSATFTRASSGTYLPLIGNLTTATTDAARFGIGDTSNTRPGLLVEAQATNLLLRSEAFDNASWGSSIGGTGSAPVVTANAGAAPDGATTADRVQFALNGGTTSSDISSLSQNVTLTQNQAYTFSAWLKTFDGTTKIVSLDVGGFHNERTVTGQWIRYSSTITWTPASGSTTANIRLRGSYATSDSADLLAWGADLKAAAYPSSYVATAGSTATRAKDVLTYPAAGNILYSVGTLSEWVRTPYPGGTTGTYTIFDTGAAADQNRLVVEITGGALRARIYGNTATGYRQISTTLNGTNWPANAYNHVLMTWDGAGPKSLNLNGSANTTVTESSWAVQTAFGSTFAFGGDRSAANQIDGLPSRIRIWNRQLTGSEIAQIYSRGL